ncbi:MAG: energy transducer TonB [Cytophagales bacterium]|nr:energy transducer TonB [Cytophagales bacterium]
MIKIVKTAFVLFLVSFIPYFSSGQKSLIESLQGEWVKDDVTLKDGSPVYDLSVTGSSFVLDFRRDSLIVSLNGINSLQSYSVIDSILNYRNEHYKITRLDKPILELTQVKQPSDVEPLKISFVYKPILDLSFAPSSYIAKNSEEVFIYRPNVIEPKFVNQRFSAMDFIYNDFRFPEYKKGGFVVRFVITKDGRMEGLRLIASSDPKYDNRLIKAVEKTKGSWLPAVYQGKVVNCEVEFNFDLDWSKTSNENRESEEAKAIAEEYYSYGQYYFMDKNYKSALFYFDKAIDKDPYLIEAYYLRAASYVFRKEIDSACHDYYQLKILGQQKAIDLYDKYCENYTPKTAE